MPPLSAAQLAMRSGRDGFVGASEIAAVVGVSQWSRPIDVWLEKTGRAEPEPSNPRASIGLRAESVLFRWWLEDTGADESLCHVGESTRHPLVRCAGCTPDTVVTDPDGPIVKLVQYKCVGARMALFWSDDGVPSDVEIQCQYEMECMRAETADVVAWLGGTDFRIVTLRRDLEFGAMLLRGAEDFWKHVESDEPPPIDGSESWRKYLQKRYPVVEKEELDPATEEVDRWANESLRSRERIEELGKDQESADNHLRALIGERAGFIGSDYRVTWSADKNGKRTLRIKRRKNPND
jgi:predicted phage-related endonuclease